MKKLLLIDGNSILNRSYYALSGKNMLSNSKGVYTNAIYGFLNTYDKFDNAENPTHVAVAFDLKGPTFRHDMYEDYKAGRRPMPDELAQQMPIMKELLDTMGFKRVEIPGYEADDILGTLSRKAEESGFEVVVLTGDRDMMQLATDKCVIQIPTTSNGSTDVHKYDRQAIIDEYGIEPRDFIEVKALMGDKSDNIPGIRGIGEKTALKLIREFKNLEGIYENLDNAGSKKQIKKLDEGRDDAFMSRKLAKIETDCQIGIKPEELVRGEIDREELFNKLKELEFNSFLKKYGLDEEFAEQADIETVEINNEKDIAFFDSITINCGFDKSGIPKNFCYTMDGSTVYMLENAELISKLMEKTVYINGHYVKEFIRFLFSTKSAIPEVSFDTAAGAYVMDASKDTYEIRELSKKYADMVFKSDNAAACDCARIHMVMEGMKQEIEKLGMKKLMKEIELPLIEVLAYMEHVGFGADAEFLREFSKKLEISLKSIEAEIYAVSGGEFNINSPKQLGHVMFEKMGIPHGKKTKTGYSTSADILERLAPEHDIAKLVLEYRKIAKLKSTYAEGLEKEIAEDGRIHTSFKQTVTSTGRLSSKEPNLQNLPIRTELGREIRKAFVTGNDDFMLTSADYSQIELRVLAHISDDMNMIQAFLDEADIHTSTAAKVFGVDERFVTSQMRRAAKAVNFGIIYGISDYGLSEDLNIPVFTAKQYINDYLEQYSGVKKYMDGIVKSAKDKGYVSTLFGRRRYLPELESKSYPVREFGKRVALNAPIQGTAADIIKIAMIKVYRRLEKKNMRSRLVLQVHDELVIESHVDEISDVEKLLREEMMSAADLKVPLSVDVKTGATLYDTK